MSGQWTSVRDTCEFSCAEDNVFHDVVGTALSLTKKQSLISCSKEAELTRHGRRGWNWRLRKKKLDWRTATQVPPRRVRPPITGRMLWDILSRSPSAEERKVDEEGHVFAATVASYMKKGARRCVRTAINEITKPPQVHRETDIKRFWTWP